MTDITSDQLETVRLSAADVDAIFELYLAARSSSPYGHLAIRSKEDYHRLFREPDDVIATGIKDQGRLIAYSICHRLKENPYQGNLLLADIDPAASTMFHGDGTFVAPAYQGRQLGHRIFRLREQQMAEHQIDHMVALAATDNLTSIGIALLSGAILVGFARDATALNYIIYGGRLRSNLQSDAAPVKIDWQDLEGQKRLFAKHNVICQLDRPASAALRDKSQDRSFVFRPWHPSRPNPSDHDAVIHP